MKHIFLPVMLLLVLVFTVTGCFGRTPAPTATRMPTLAPTAAVTPTSVPEGTSLPAVPTPDPTLLDELEDIAGVTMAPNVSPSPTAGN